MNSVKLETLSRSEFDLNTNRLARAYQQIGVQKGDFVTISLTNSIEFFESVVATWKLGAIPNPLNSNLPRREIVALAELVKPKLMVGTDSKILVNCINIRRGYKPDQKLPNTALPDEIPPHFKAMASGGSTGRPKIIVSGNQGTVDTVSPFPTLKPNDVFLLTGPLHHSAPFQAAAYVILSGGTVIIPSYFDAEETLKLVEEYKVTHMTLVPSMMLRIWRLGEITRNKYDLSSIISIQHGSAVCPKWLKQNWIEWLGEDRIVEAYSSTEAAGYTIITGTEWLRKKGSVGRPDPKACQFKIIDETNNEIGPNEIGEIYTKPYLGPDSNYFYGELFHYIGSESKQLPQGWISTGDMGYLDEDGYLYLTDRKSDVINCGGANIYPAEIEASLEAHTSVTAAVVIGLPHEDFGEYIHAILNVSTEVTNRSLRLHLREYVTPNKFPMVFEVVDEVLRDDAGKVRRKELREARLRQWNDE